MQPLFRASFLVFLFGVCVGTPAGQAQAATRTAVSLSQADVQEAVKAAADGDIVQLPAGKAIWTGAVTIDKCITLCGEGADKTIIVGGEYKPSTTHPTHRIFDIHSKPGGLTRLTALALDGGTGAREPNNKGMVSLDGDSTTWRIDHVRFRATRTCAMHIYASGGVIDHNTFELVGWTFGIYGFNGGSFYGDAAWTEPADLGSGTKPFFIEDNEFVATELSFALDGWRGQHVVIRHNRFKNAGIGNHGTETSGRLHGARSFEIYENTLTFEKTTYPNAVGFRSGTGVVFKNSITGVRGGFHVDNYRDWQAYRPWGIASGENPFDKNDVDKVGKPIIHDFGNHTSSKGAQVLKCAGKKWTANQWFGYSLHNTRTGRSSIILSNTADTITVRIEGSHGPTLAWDPGDGFMIERCLIALDQMGRGKGKLITGDVPQPAAWPEQEAEPAYFWDNTLDGRPTGLHSSSPHVKEGVDFFNGIAKPGYQPYIYPHPLVK